MADPKTTLSQEDIETIYALAEKLTGSCQKGKYRKEVLVNNVMRRFRAVGATHLEDYLEYVDRRPDELKELLSALTIHTTEWFRENVHYRKLDTLLKNSIRDLGNRKFRVLSVASSTGEEAYSCALVLEKYRTLVPTFDYTVTGIDVDPVSIATAQKAIYRKREDFRKIPKEYLRYLLMGSGKTDGFFTLSKDIRRRVRFESQNLLNLPKRATEGFDVVFCRNVLIYFDPETVKQIIQSLIHQLKPSGILILGNCETIEPGPFHLKRAGSSVYSRSNQEAFQHLSSREKVLVVDDSPLIREKLSRILAKGDFHPIGAASAQEATDLLKTNAVSLITLDLNMPGVDGLTWLREQKKNGLKIPVVVISGANHADASSVLNALKEGAHDYIDKAELSARRSELPERIKIIIQSTRKERATGKTPKAKKLSLNRGVPDLILVGASTGGTEALTRLLRHIPRNCPPVLVVQHLAPGFLRPFAERLASASGLSLGDAVDGTELKPNHLYMALESQHIGVRKKGEKYLLSVSASPPINRHRPSVDFLFRSCALFKSNIYAFILTGMGNDGAQGLLDLKTSGNVTFAQDRESCVVYGMPKEAAKLNAALIVGDLPELRGHLEDALMSESSTKKAA